MSVSCHGLPPAPVPPSARTKLPPVIRKSPAANAGSVAAICDQAPAFSVNRATDTAPAGDVEMVLPALSVSPPAAAVTLLLRVIAPAALGVSVPPLAQASAEVSVMLPACEP